MDNNISDKASTKKVLEFNDFKEKTLLTEEDINNLFLGFIRLIKKSVALEKDKAYKNQIQNYQKKINSYMIDLQKKEDEIEKLKLELSKT